MMKMKLSLASLSSCYCFTSLLLLLSSSLVDAEVVCPPAADYAPCQCSDYFLKPGKILLTCKILKLGDSKISDILDAFLKTPGVSPVGCLELSSNQLTRVPSQMKLFDQLEWVELYNNNITFIESGAFNFPNASDPLQYLDLTYNKMTTIAPGTFTGDGYGSNYTKIQLSHNELTRFESAVFQPVLEKMAPYGESDFTYISTYQNPIECDCHLAWLVRDNRHLLPVAGDGQCVNDGTFIVNLDPNGFTDCPSFMCPLGYDGSYADPFNCSSYYVCTENVAVLKDCPTGEVFDPETRRCDVAANVSVICHQHQPTSPSPSSPSSKATKIRVDNASTSFVFLI